MHIFISYAKKDTRQLATRLRDLIIQIPGVTAWMDESLIPGPSWARQIEQEIDRCDYFLVLISPDVNRPESQTQHLSFVYHEIIYAQNQHKKIIPALAQPTKMPVQLAAFQYVDLTRDPNTGIQNIVQFFRQEAAQQGRQSATDLEHLMQSFAATTQQAQALLNQQNSRVVQTELDRIEQSASALLVQVTSPSGQDQMSPEKRLQLLKNGSTKLNQLMTDLNKITPQAQATAELKSRLNRVEITVDEVDKRLTMQISATEEDVSREKKRLEDAERKRRSEAAVQLKQLKDRLDEVEQSALEFNDTLDELEQNKSFSGRQLLDEVITQQLRYEKIKQILEQILADTNFVPVLQNQFDYVQGLLAGRDKRLQIVTQVGRKKDRADQIKNKFARPAKLQTWNPFSWIKFLYWVFFSPIGIHVYKSYYGDYSLVGVRGWVASTLVWLPLLIPTLGIVVRPAPAISSLPNFYNLFWLFVLAAWFINGKAYKSSFESKDSSGASLVVAYIISVPVVLLSSLTLFHLLPVVIVLLMIIYAGYAENSFLESNIEGVLQTIVSFFVAGTLVGVGVYDWAIQTSEGGVGRFIGIVGFIIVSLIADLGAILFSAISSFILVGAAPKSEDPIHYRSSLRRLLFFLLPVFYLILIWIYWFEGWRSLAR